MGEGDSLTYSTNGNEKRKGTTDQKEAIKHIQRTNKYVPRTGPKCREVQVSSLNYSIIFNPELSEE